MSIALLGVFAAPAQADTATLALGSSTIVPGGSTTVTVELTSTSGDPLVVTVNVAAQGTATGSVEFSNPGTSTTPPTPDAGGFNCAESAGGPTTYECLWTGAAKDPGELATLTLTATASADVVGTFGFTVVDETLTPVQLAAADLLVDSGTPATTTTTTTTTTAPSPTTSTVPGSAGAAQGAQPLKLTG